MPLLETLLDELITQILSDVLARDLSSISLVSSRLRNISQPLLYHESHLLISAQHPTSFDLYFATLLTPACESLGTHTRCMTIDWRSNYIRHNDSDLPFLASARARFPLGSNISQIIQAILLLQLVPRIQTLHLPLLHEPRRMLFSLHPLYQLTSLPPTLRDFSYEWHTPCNWINIENLLTILSLSLIRSISVRGIFGNNFTRSETVLSAAAAGTSSLTHLTIHSGSIAPQPLQYILSIPRALTHFVYQPTLEDIAFDLACSGSHYSRCNSLLLAWNSTAT